MRIPILPMARRPARAARSPVRPRPNGPSCRWSSRAKCILDPNHAVRAVRRPLHGEYVEAHRTAMPFSPAEQQVSGGADDFALLAPGNGLERAAELKAAALPYFDDRQHAVIEANQIELAGLALEIARQNLNTAYLQIVGRQLFRSRAAPRALIRHRHTLRRPNRRRSRHKWPIRGELKSSAYRSLGTPALICAHSRSRRILL